MNQQEIEAFVEPYKEKYGWSLIARSGNGGLEDADYSYLYVDDAGICITIDPVDKGFSFSKNVDFLFKLKSGKFTPLDHKDHFEKNYLRFRNIVLEKQLM